jgi:hypothetical protein
MTCVLNVDRVQEFVDFWLEFCRDFPSENGCHLPLLTAVNFVLVRYAADMPEYVVDCTARASELLLPLWETKTARLRMQVLVFQRFALSIHSYRDTRSNLNQSLVFSMYWEKVKTELRRSKHPPMVTASLATFDWRHANSAVDDASWSGWLFLEVSALLVWQLVNS